MMAERLAFARRNLVMAGTVLAFLALSGLAVLMVRGVQSRLATAEKNSSTLAQQVRDLGGKPLVTPPPGPAGTQGAQGPQGPSGAAGPAGASGRPGAAGSPGPAGPSGQPGGSGPAGTAGSPGPAGPQGPKGDQGPAGQDGKDGSPPSGWTFTYLGTSYTCAPDSPGATTYTCSPTTPALRRKNG